MSPLFLALFLVLSAVLLIAVAATVAAAWDFASKANITQYKQYSDSVMNDIFSKFTLVAAALGTAAVALYIYTAFREPEPEL